jgi:choline dehydrogenase-like flavoprotein
MTPLTPQEARLRTLLRLIALGYGLFSLVLLVVPPTRPIDAVFGNPVMAALGCAAWGMVALMAWFASGDVRRFRVMALASGGLLLYGALTSVVLHEITGGGARTLMLISALIDGLAGLLLFLLIVDCAPSADFVAAWKTNKPQTNTEKTLRPILIAVAVVAALASLIVLFGALRAGTSLGAPMIAFGVVFSAGLAVCAGLAALDLRAYSEYITIGLLGALMALGAHLLALPGQVPASEVHNALVGALVLDLALVLALWIMRARLHRALIDYLSFFNPLQFWSLAAISDGLIEGGAGELLRPHEIALRVDQHLASFPAPKLALARIVILAVDFIMPLIFTNRPPLGFMSLSERRDFINTQFKVNLTENKGIFGLLDRLRLEDVTNAVAGAMRFAMQFAYLGYYGDAKVQDDLKYTPFSIRAVEREIDTTPIRRHPPLHVVTPTDLNKQGTDVLDDVDVVIIGSGAGGAILAEQLLERGRRVLILEKGKYLHPDDFTEDEIDMIGKLYGDNALQVTASMRFSILQGSCVGGTTVANNAISFKTPHHILDRWNAQYGAGIDESAYWAAQTAVMTRLHIEPIDRTARTRRPEDIFNPLASRLRQGIDALLTPGTYTYTTMATNIDDCLGCGYCNMGCKFGRKLSMADEVLPSAQQAHPGKLTILSEAEAVHLEADGADITGIQVRLGGQRIIHIRKPKTIVVSGGVIASSWLLLRSHIGKNLPIGRGVTFNMGSPLHAYFPSPIHAYDGLQMSHYLALEGARDYIFETWFNPPVAQALVMPGWLDSHFANMKEYAHFASMGVLVGTDTQMDRTYIRGARLFPGTPELVYEPTKRDLDTLLDALILMGRILLASGASKVFASTAKYHSFTGYVQGEAAPRAQAMYENEEDLIRYLKQLVHSDKDLLLNSSHPQGGNALGAVLDKDFRVRGYRNLYVCDASVFPSALTVNPQLSIMNMAWYAGSRVE